MKSHYDHTVTMKEAVRIGEKAAKYNFQMAIDKYNREELPRIQASYAKMFRKRRVRKKNQRRLSMRENR